jgi:hypothetical protein
LPRGIYNKKKRIDYYRNVEKRNLVVRFQVLVVLEHYLRSTAVKELCTRLNEHIL